MNTKRKTKLAVTLVLMQLYFSTIRAKPYRDAFRHESPSGKTEAEIFRTPSESTPEEGVYKPFRASANDGWLDLPGDYEGTGNALKVPIGNGWEIMILAGVFYMLFLSAFARYDRKKSRKRER